MNAWRVGFVAAARGEARWWQWLLRPGFVHCWAARRLGRGLWLWVEWVPHRLSLHVVPAAHVRRCSLAAAEVAVWRAPDGGERPLRAPLVPLHHCASIVAHALGLWLRPPGTPWALACALRRRGAVGLKGRLGGGAG